MDTEILVVAAAGFVLAVFALVALARRRATRRREERDARLRRDAAAVGIVYGTGDRPSPTGGPDVARAGPRRFSGSARMLSWVAEVETENDRSGPRSRRSRIERTRISFPAIRTAPGRFVFAVALPPGARAPEIPSGEGLFVKLALKAAEALLDVYVGGYFGPQHRDLVNVEGAERPPAPPGFFVLSTDPSVASRLLAPDAVALLDGLRDVVKGQPSFGVLATNEGLVWAVPDSVLDVAALKAAADRVGAFAAAVRA